MAGFRDLLDDLIARVRGTDIAEIEFRMQGLRISLRRRRPSSGHTGPNPGESHAGASPAGDGPAPGEVDILSPLNGIFYAAPSPGDAPFVRVGDEIAPGQVVGLVEAMKVFNEIVAEVAGAVSAILVSEGAEVAEGGPVLRVRLAGPD